MTGELELDPLADRVIEALDGFSAEALAAFARGLQVSECPVLARFSLAILYLSLERERGEEAGWMTRFTLVNALRTAALERTLIERLEASAHDPFWRSVCDAAGVIAEEREHAHPSGVA